MNDDIQSICTNESQAKQHYCSFGIYQNRQYKNIMIKNSINSEYNSFSFLFHKYILRYLNWVYIYITIKKIAVYSLMRIHTLT